MTGRFRKIALLLAMAVTGSPAIAQTFIDPASVTGGRTRIAPLVSMSEVDYEREDGQLLSIDRQTLGVELSQGITKNVDGVATLGIVLDAKTEGLARDDGGFNVGIGARGVVYNRGNAGVTAYGFFNWLQEDFKGPSDISTEVQTYDLRIGSALAFIVAGHFQPYVGLDLALLRGGSIWGRVANISVKRDLKKDELLALKLGINLWVQSVMLRPEVTLLGEQTVTFAAGIPL